MESPQIPRTAAPYAARLDRTLTMLQDRVTKQEAALKDLRATNSSISSQPYTGHESHLQQIRSLNATYESLITQDPYLPSHGSPLPALLALRSINVCMDETQQSITKTELDLKNIQKRLEEERSDFKDATLIQTRLESRILSLQGEIEERSQKTPGEMAKELFQKIKNNKNHYDSETGKLVKAFNGFIDNRLASMLAAEELGGPIVGESMDIDEEMLEDGFNSQGRSMRKKNGVNEDKRQRRIDEIWGSRPSENGKTKEPWDEKRAAAAEMRDLAERLLNSLVEAEGGGAYVELERESAAARFLVRSKVAQFHPRNACRLRLVDFGRELDS